jgi:hypothetical protein
LLFGSVAIAPVAGAHDTPTREEQLAAFGPGSKADKATAKAVASTVRRFVKLIGAKDPAAVNLLEPSLWRSGSRDEEIAVLRQQVKPKLYRVGDVQEHQDTGTVSAKVVTSGWYTASSYYTERWFLVYHQETDGYAITQFVQVPTEVVDPLVGASVRQVFSEQRLSIKPAGVPAATPLVIEAVSHGQRWLSTGVYELPDDLSVQQGQAMVIEDYRSLPFLGATPLRPKDEFTFGVLVQPGRRYLIQEYTLDDLGGLPEPLAGGRVRYGPYRRAGGGDADHGAVANRLTEACVDRFDALAQSWS